VKLLLENGLILLKDFANLMKKWKKCWNSVPKKKDLQQQKFVKSLIDSWSNMKWPIKIEDAWTNLISESNLYNSIIQLFHLIQNKYTVKFDKPYLSIGSTKNIRFIRIIRYSEIISINWISTTMYWIFKIFHAIKLIYTIFLSFKSEVMKMNIKYL
jgi:hypothetical protein